MDDNGSSRQQIITASMWEGSFQWTIMELPEDSKSLQILCGMIASRDTNKDTTSALTECKKKIQWRVLITKKGIIIIGMSNAIPMLASNEIN